MFNWTNFEILLDVLIHFSPELIKTKNTELDLIDIFNLMIWTVYYLYSKKVISIESIIKTAEYRNLYYVYFYPEIDQYDHNYSEKLKFTILSDCYIDKDLQKFFKTILQDPEKHKQNRDISYHPSTLHKIIREDDIDSFQSIISRNNYSFNYRFEYSFYERIYSTNKNFSLIQVAAIYGSIQIFKYLWMQDDIQIDDFVLFCAISGRNYDIIHICEEKIDSPWKIVYSINSHQNELTDYFIEKSDELNKDINDDDDCLYKNLDINSFGIAILSANFHIILSSLHHIVDLIEKEEGIYLFYGANYDFDLFNLLYSHRNKDVDLCDIFHPYYATWVEKGMTSAITKTLLDQSAKNIFTILITYSIKSNRKITGIILDMFKEYKNSELKDALEYCKNYSFQIEWICYSKLSDENLVTKFTDIFDLKMTILNS